MADTPTLAEAIVRELRDEILGGRYRPGERLPSERDLAARIGANRGSIREALKKLEQEAAPLAFPKGADNLDNAGYQEECA